jgi:FlaG/FlaF family flagellin (archaellin)
VGRAGIVLTAAVVVGVAALSALGIFGYSSERDQRQAEYVTGDSTSPDGIRLDVTVQRVDPTARQLTVVVLAHPRGRYARDGDSLVPSQDLVIDTSSLSQGTLRFRAGDRIQAQNVTLGLDTGVLTDYPFDHYTTTIGFLASVADQPVPGDLEFRNYDPLFRIEPTGAAGQQGGVAADLLFDRTRGTFILALFLMAAMWVLALSVLGASVILVRHHHGLVYPALGWMAATLFALVVVRNAVPGSPPIGSLFDYAAFLWSEAIIAVSVGVVSVHGVVVEHRRGTAVP